MIQKFEVCPFEQHLVDQIQVSRKKQLLLEKKFLQIFGEHSVVIMEEE